MVNNLCEPARFSLYQGDGKVVHIRVKDSDGEDVDVDGATAARFGLFDALTKSQMLLLTLADDPATITLSGAVMSVTISSSLSGALELGQYLFEADVTLAGLLQTVIQGEAVVKEKLISE